MRMRGIDIPMPQTTVEDAPEMNPGTRACIAYLAARNVLGERSRGVYCELEQFFFRIGGELRGRRVWFYDFERGCEFTGLLPDLRDGCTGARLEFHQTGAIFYGRDSATDRWFSGQVHGHRVHLFDHQAARFFYFCLQRLG